MLKKIFLKLLWERKNDYIRVILSGIFCISVIFFSAAVGSGLVYISVGEKASMTELVMEVEKNFVIPYVLLIFLMILIILSYIRKRAHDYAMLNILGMKKKHRYMYIGCEYLGIILGSIVGGLILGEVESLIVKRFMENIFNDLVDNIFLGVTPIILTLIISIVMFGIGFCFCDQYIACMGIENVTSVGKVSGKNKVNSPWPIIGGVVIFIITLISIVTYWGQIGYTIPATLGMIAMAILILFGGGYYLERLRRKKKKYFKKILWLNNWYHMFYSHVNFSYIVSAFLLIILFGFNIVLVDNLPVSQTENYPYDLVWGANEKDRLFIKKISEKYDVQTELIPCIRVTSGNCAEHIGISAAEYKRLTGENVALKNKEIYIVYQWDRSEYGTIGVDFGKLHPRLYMGCATPNIWVYTQKTSPGNKFTRDYEVKGVTRKIITGNFKTRVLSTSNMNTDVFEDIIVFSDKEYKRISNKAEGSNLTVLMNTPKKHSAVLKKVSEYAEKHSQVNFFDYRGGNLIYDRKQCLIEDRERKMLNVTATLIDMIVLFISVIFILLEKAASDYEILEWKYLFYYRTGMSEKKRKRNMIKEVTAIAKVGLLVSIPVVTTMMFVKIVYKQMSIHWTYIYLVEATVIVMGVTSIIMIIMRFIAGRMFKRSERNSEDE